MIVIIAILLSSCQIIETSQGRNKIKRQLKKVIATQYDNAFKVDNVWYYQNYHGKPTYKAVIVNPLDKNIEFNYFVENPNSFTFDTAQFNDAFQNISESVHASYQFLGYTKTAFPNASVKTNVIDTKNGQQRRMAHIYVNHTLEQKDSILKSIETECKTIANYYDESAISFNFYFSENNELPKNPISENGLLKYDIYYDLYQYHYRIDFELKDSVYTKTDESLTLNLSGPIAMILQKQIKNWLGESTYPETESDSTYLIVDRTIEKDIHWAAFSYKDASARPQIGYINVFTYEIRPKID